MLESVRFFADQGFCTYALGRTLGDIDAASSRHDTEAAERKYLQRVMLCRGVCDRYVLDKNDCYDIVAGQTACAFRHCDRGDTGWDPLSVPVTQTAVGHAVGAVVPETLYYVAIGVAQWFAALQGCLQHLRTVPSNCFRCSVAEHSLCRSVPGHDPGFGVDSEGSIRGKLSQVRGVSGHFAGPVDETLTALMAGTIREKLDPRPSSDSTSTLVPNSFALRSTIERPRPRLPFLLAGSFSTR